MRLNKSFIVKRSVSGLRELLAASKNLANYIQHSLPQEHIPAWIAQREGRAKDGVDRTEPVIIKMLSRAGTRAARRLMRTCRAWALSPWRSPMSSTPAMRKANELYQRASQAAPERRAGRCGSIGRA